MDVLKKKLNGYLLTMGGTMNASGVAVSSNGAQQLKHSGQEAYYGVLEGTHRHALNINPERMSLSC